MDEAGDSENQTSNQGSVFQECDTDSEVFRQCFRQFQYNEAAGLQEAYDNLWELCCQWLKPMMRSKGQILELLVLEQFLNILAPAIETQVRSFGEQHAEIMLAYTEVIQRELLTLEQQIDSQELFLEELAPLGMEDILPNLHLDSALLQGMGSAPDVTLAEAWMPQAGPQELNYAAAGECQPFPDLGFQSQWDISSPEVLPTMGADTDPPQWPACSLPDPELSFPEIDIEESQPEEQLDNLLNMELEFFDSSVDSNVLLGPSSPGIWEQLGYLLEQPTELPRRDVTVPVPSQEPSVEETAERSSLQEPRRPRTRSQGCPREKSYPCVHCGKGFGTEKHLKGHVKIHSGDLPHKCNVCEKGFLRKSDLRRHQRVHNSEKHYECSVCNNRFSQKKQLELHQVIHADKKTYWCQLCKVIICHRPNYVRHVQSHAGPKSHICNICGRNFAQKSRLTLHYRTHTEERPYQCEFCGNSYKHKSSLVSHLKKHARD